MDFAVKGKYRPVQQSESSADLRTPFAVSDKGNIEGSLVETSHGQWTLWSLIVLILFLLSSNIYTWLQLMRHNNMEAIFSPAASAIRYKDVTWTAGVGHGRTSYQGPLTDENNRLWEDLYQFGISRIPINEARQLVNRSSPVPNDPGYYAITLDVFHELHCLNMLRQRIFWNQSEPYDENLTMSHMDHCIDSIRQSLMCSSDITPIPYAWHEKEQAVLPTTGVVHTCRDFDAIREWGRERQSHKFNVRIRVEDPLGNMVHET